ncbi:AsmA family protein [Methylocapsa palsarum]|uniref:AsmA protein n=1 Tax=Methylocapsa palsarum TaxID=1612308 RepID=A0A1I3YLF8_9HYPH|nr:AsmA family protein [Methylocapsa palsarum]SFK32662.1 AsmA protein [Methylocapsa palsarum]
MAEMAPLASPSSPRSRRLGRAAQAAILVVGLGALGSIAVQWLFSTAALSAAIVSEIRQMTGLAVVSKGATVLVVLPQPHINISDIELSDASGVIQINARVLKSYLRISALLRGRLEIGSVILNQPEMVVDLDRGPATAPESAIGLAANAAPASPQAKRADEGGLGAVSFIDGAAHLSSRSKRTDFLIDQINVKLDWRKLGAAATANGEARLNGETFSFAARIARPSEVLRGQQSDMSLSVGSPSVTLTTEGVLKGSANPGYAGRIIATAPSLRKLAEAGGYMAPLPGPFEAMTLHCAADIGLSNATFSDLRLRLDGNDFEGVLAVDAAAHPPMVSGTLAANVLSLRPFLSGLPRPLGRDGQWNHDSFDLKPSKLTDIDLRISAARTVLPALEIEDAAVSLMSRNNRLQITLADAKAYGGSINGRAILTLNDEALEVHASGALNGVESGEVAASLLHPWRFAGPATASVDIQGKGASVSDVMRNLEGDANVAFGRGELDGVDLGEALRRIEIKPLALASDIQHGETPFDAAHFKIKIAHGVAAIEDGVLTNSRLILNFKGEADIGEQALNLHGAASPFDKTSDPAPEARQFQFDVAGPWDGLEFVPDARSLIRHSGAAAPLFSPRPHNLKPADGAR